MSRSGWWWKWWHSCPHVGVGCCTCRKEWGSCTWRKLPMCRRPRGARWRHGRRCPFERQPWTISWLRRAWLAGGDVVMRPGWRWKFSFFFGAWLDLSRVAGKVREADSPTASSFFLIKERKTTVYLLIHSTDLVHGELTRLSRHSPDGE